MLISVLSALILVCVSSAEPHDGLVAHEHPHPPPKRVGRLKARIHDVGGTVYAVDSRTIFIQEFSYDGQGPDAFFWVSKTPRPDEKGGIILPYPFEGKFYPNKSRRPRRLGKYDKVDVTLTLPENWKVSDVKNLSVWCRGFGVNFGDLEFTKDLSEFDNI